MSEIDNDDFCRQAREKRIVEKEKARQKKTELNARDICVLYAAQEASSEFELSDISLDGVISYVPYACEKLGLQELLYLKENPLTDGQLRDYVSVTIGRLVHRGFLRSTVSFSVSNLPENWGELLENVSL